VAQNHYLSNSGSTDTTFRVGVTEAGEYAVCYFAASAGGLHVGSAGQLTVALPPSVSVVYPATAVVGEPTTVSFSGRGMGALDSALILAGGSMDCSTQTESGAAADGVGRFDRTVAPSAQSQTAAYAVTLLRPGSFTLCYRFGAVPAGGTGAAALAPFAPAGAVTASSQRSVTALLPPAHAHGLLGGRSYALSVRGTALGAADRVALAYGRAACPQAGHGLDSVSMPSFAAAAAGAAAPHADSAGGGSATFDVRMPVVQLALTDNQLSYLASDHVTTTVVDASEYRASTLGTLGGEGPSTHGLDNAGPVTGSRAWQLVAQAIAAHRVEFDCKSRDGKMQICTQASAVYSVCYSFGGNASDYSTQAGVLVVNAAPEAGQLTPSALSVGKSTVVTVSGTGLSASDSVVLVALGQGGALETAAAAAAACGKDAADSPSVMQNEPVAPAAALEHHPGPLLFDAKFRVSVAADAANAGSYAVCYQYAREPALGFGALAGILLVAAASASSITVGAPAIGHPTPAPTRAPTQTGLVGAPPAAAAGAMVAGQATVLTVSGSGLGAGDRLLLVSGGACLAKGGMPGPAHLAAVSPVSAQASAATSFSASAPVAGAYSACYAFGAAGDFSTKVGSLVVAEAAAVAATSPSSGSVGRDVVLTFTGAGLHFSDRIALVEHYPGGFHPCSSVSASDAAVIRNEFEKAAPDGSSTTFVVKASAKKTFDLCYDFLGTGNYAVAVGTVDMQ
jgi:hypothetical protein